MLRSGIADARDYRTPDPKTLSLCILFILCIDVNNPLVAVRAVEADPSRFVALRRSSCVFVDSFFSFVSIKQLSAGLASAWGCGSSRLRAVCHCQDSRAPERQPAIQGRR